MPFRWKIRQLNSTDLEVKVIMETTGSLIRSLFAQLKSKLSVNDPEKTDLQLEMIEAFNLKLVGEKYGEEALDKYLWNIKQAMKKPMREVKNQLYNIKGHRIVEWKVEDALFEKQPDKSWQITVMMKAVYSG